MSAKQDYFEKVLREPYDHGQFVQFVREFLTGINTNTAGRYNKEYSNFSFYVDGYYHIGTYQSDDGDKIAVLSVNLKRGETVERARSMQRNFVKPLLEKSGSAGALVAFYTSEEPEKWRLSFIRLDYEFSKGKISEKLTPAKRYSYLVGKGEPCNTARQRLFPIFRDDTRNPGLDELEDAFSVEKVSQDFFKLYEEKYHQVREYLEANEDFINEAEEHGFTSEQFAKKLLGQIVFLYFIQKKGWLGVGSWPSELTEKQYNDLFYTKGGVGRVIKEYLPRVYAQNDDKYRFLGLGALKNIPDDAERDIADHMPGRKPWGSGDKGFVRTLFNFCVKQGKEFFDDFLEPLFYDTLNKNRGEMAYSAHLHCRIPFLNGGLFEELKGYDWRNNDFNIPNDIFSNREEKGEYDADGILDIFDRYNFTMNEDEPMEREVAIDPEMLGKVFENLLDVKDRKSKGAFYTPREIVHYMCQETLINYLTGKSGISEGAVRDFILYGEYFKDEDTEKTKAVTDKKTGKKKYVLDETKEMMISDEIFSFKKNVNRLEELDKLLENVKVADLAVGSGAFPLGMLNEIVKARDTLTAYLSIGMNAFQKKSFIAYNRKLYDLKINTIRNSLFACDIEPSAVDIAKLRLWLSIVIDDEITEDAGNGEFDQHSKPKQLPNLDCNIICGNSLIDEFKGVKLINESELLGNVSDNSQIHMYQAGADALIAELIELQRKLFYSTDHNDKEELKQKIKRLYEQAVMEQMGHDPDLIHAYEDAVEEPSSPFVLWELYFPTVFRDNGGFDIVIGNPPYVGESGHKDIFRPISNTEFGKRFHQGKMDLFYFFFHKGIDLLKDGGELSLITTNYYPTATGANKLREDFKRRTEIRKLINFNEVKVFESALGQHNMITMLHKSMVERSIICNCILCHGSYVATNSQMMDILNGSGSTEMTVTNISQDNLFDGKESYIRLGGVKSTSTDSGESIIDKISAVECLLGDCADVNQGVLTGCDTLTNRHLSKLPRTTSKTKNDGIFVLDYSVERDKDVMKSFSKGKKLLRDFYKNSDIGRYWCSNTPTKKIIYYTGELKKEEYPDIYDHMLCFKPILEERLSTYNEKYHWTAIHRPRNGRVFESDVEKIVVPYRTKENSFAFNNIEWFCRSDCYVITNVSKMDIKCLLAILNSDTIFFWLYHRGKRKGEVLELFQKPLSEIPIAIPDREQQKRLSKLSDIIVKEKQKNRLADTTAVEDEINEIVYDLYGFSQKERSIIRDLNRKGE